MAPCYELIELLPQDQDNLLDRQRPLHYLDFWKFVAPWVRSADRAIAQKDADFEGFIYLWVAVNAWASYIVADSQKSDVDLYLVAALGQDKELEERFEQLKKSEPAFRRMTEEFAALWPVFKVRTLHKLGIGAWLDGNRDKYVRRVLHCPQGAPQRKQYAPSCFLRHEKQKQEGIHLRWHGPPNDWQHTISAIYMVRCNLFHGGKGFENTNDWKFVHLAFHILWRVWSPEALPHFPPHGEVQRMGLVGHCEVCGARVQDLARYEDTFRRYIRPRYGDVLDVLVDSNRFEKLVYDPGTELATSYRGAETRRLVLQQGELRPMARKARMKAEIVGIRHGACGIVIGEGETRSLREIGKYLETAQDCTHVWIRGDPRPYPLNDAVLFVLLHSHRRADVYTSQTGRGCFRQVITCDVTEFPNLYKLYFA